MVQHWHVEPHVISSLALTDRDLNNYLMTILPDYGYSFEQQLHIQTTGDTQRDQSRDGSSMGEGKYTA